MAPGGTSSECSSNVVHHLRPLRSVSERRYTCEVPERVPAQLLLQAGPATVRPQMPECGTPPLLLSSPRSSARGPRPGSLREAAVDSPPQMPGGCNSWAAYSCSSFLHRDRSCKPWPLSTTAGLLRILSRERRRCAGRFAAGWSRNPGFRRRVLPPAVCVCHV